MHKSWLTALTLTARVRQWEKILVEHRAKTTETKKQYDGALAIQVHYRMWKWNRDNRALVRKFCRASSHCLLLAPTQAGGGCVRHR